MSEDLTLKSSIEELEKSILEEENLDDLKTIIELFNLNIQKKNIIRNSKLSDIQDKVTQEMLDRINYSPDSFSNNELTQLHKIIQESVNKSEGSLETINSANIQVNQQININQPTFDRESRSKILSAVKQLMEENIEDGADKTESL